MWRPVPLFTRVRLTRVRSLLARLFGSPGFLDTLDGGSGGPAGAPGVREPKGRGPKGRQGAVALLEPDGPGDPVDAVARRRPGVL
jgi:hypothetical protein